MNKRNFAIVVITASAFAGGHTAALARQAPRLESLRLIARTLDRAHGMVRALIEAHRGETSVTDADLAAWLVVHAVNGMVDGAILGPPQRLAEPRLAEAIVGHVLGALGAKTPPRHPGARKRS